MGTSGIVGPRTSRQRPGAGYTFKLLRSDRIGVAFFGDGRREQRSAFHEGLNMASIWKLPALFVCENNQYATEVPFHYAAGNPSGFPRGLAYGMPGIEVDGNDVLAVHQAAEFAIARCGRETARRSSNASRTGRGPTPRAWAILPIAPRMRSNSGKRAGPDPDVAPMPHRGRRGE